MADSTPPPPLSPDEQAALAAAMPPKEGGVRGWLVDHGVLKPEAEVNAGKAPSLIGGGSSTPIPTASPAAPAAAAPIDPSLDTGARGALVNLGLLKPQSQVNAEFPAAGAGVLAPGSNAGAPNVPTSPVAKSIRGALEARGVIPKEDEPKDHVPQGQGAAAQTPQIPYRTGGGGGAPQNKAGLAMLDQLDAIDKKTIGGYEDVKNANKAAQDAQGDLAFGTQAALQNTQDALGKLDEQQKAHIQQATDSMKQTQQELATKMANLPKIDPDQYWESKSTGQKILTAIALAAGQFAASAPHTAGGQNGALAMFQAGVQNNIDAQKANLKNEWEKLTKGQDIAKDNWARSVWMSEQMDKAKLESIEKGKLQIQGYAAQAGSEEAKARLAALISDATKLQDQTEAGMLTRRYQFLQAQAAAAAAGAGPSLASIQNDWRTYAKKQLAEGKTPIEFNDYAKTFLTGKTGASQGGIITDPNKVNENDRKYLVPLGNGTYGKAATEDQAKEIRGADPHFENAMDAINAVREARAKAGGGSMSATDTAILNGKLKAIIPSLNHLSGLNRMTDTDVHLIESMLPQDANAYNLPGRPNVDKMLDNAAQIVQQRRDNMYKGAGVTPAGGGAPAANGPAVKPGWK